MTQEKIIQQAQELAKNSNFKGLIIGLSDGNFFFVKEASDINPVINHCRMILATKGEPTIHALDFSSDPFKHDTITVKDLAKAFSGSSNADLSENSADENGASNSTQESVDVLLQKALSGDKDALKAISFEDLMDLTVKELKELAEVHQIEVDPRAKKTDIVALLMSEEDKSSEAQQGEDQKDAASNPEGSDEAIKS